MDYISLDADRIGRSLFDGFVRRQVVRDCWRKINGSWQIRACPFIDDWGEAEYAELVRCLKHTAATGGLVLGAFSGAALKGFVSVEPVLFGQKEEYLDLSSIHVSADMRGKGIGRELFCRAKSWAKANGAQKLYISAHSAVETQAFYRAMGCVEAREYHSGHVEREPFDCQLECSL